MTNNDYGAREVPLIPAGLYGMRSFKIRNDGTLQPLHRNTHFVYEEGVNVSACDSEPVAFTDLFGGRIWNYSATIKEMYHPDGKTPDIGCTCGFYAYFEDTPETAFMLHFEPHYVNGIVRASGKCIVGDKGFRAEKLEIVALVADKPAIPSKFRAWCNDTFLVIAQDGEKWWRRYMYFLGLYWVLMLLNLFVFDDNKYVEFAYDCAMTIIWSACIVIMMNMFYMLFKLKDIATTGLYGRPSPELTANLMKMYPNVPLFKTMQEAQKAFPLTKTKDLPQ